MTGVLALDIATQMGWAFHKPGMERPHFGTLNLRGDPGKVGVPIKVLHEFLTDRHTMYGGITDFVFEAQHIGAFGKKKKDVECPHCGTAVAVTTTAQIDINVVRKLISLGGHVEWFAEEVDARCFAVHIGTHRKHFCGRGNLNREAAKMAAMDECRRLGLDPPDDNAAEAMGILDYYLSILKPAGKPYHRPWRDTGLFAPLGAHG